MEHTTLELVLVEGAIAEGEQLQQLTDLQLSIVGGGIGDVVPH